MNTKAGRTYWVGCGVLFGPLVLTCLRLAITLGEKALVGTLGRGSIAHSIPDNVLNSLLPGAILGGLSVALWNGWAVRDRERLQRALRGVSLVLLILVASRILLMILYLSRRPLSSVFVYGPAFIPVQLRWIFFIVATDVVFQWTIVLAIVGKLAANRIAYEHKRAHQFDTLV